MEETLVKFDNLFLSLEARGHPTKHADPASQKLYITPALLHLVAIQN